MSNTDDTLEQELRALLDRVLSAQFHPLQERIEKLAGAVSALTRANNDASKNLNTLSENLHEQFSENADLARSNALDYNKALIFQAERLHSVLMETRTILGVQAHEGRQEVFERIERNAVRASDASDLILATINQRADEEAGSSKDIAVQSMRLLEEKSIMMQSRLDVLEHRIRLLTSLSITTIIFLVAVVAGAVAIYFGVAKEQLRG